MTFLNMLLLMDVLLKKRKENNKKEVLSCSCCTPPVKTNETDLTERPISLPVNSPTPRDVGRW